MTALVNDGGDLVPFKGQMIARADIPRSSRVRPVAVDSMDDALRYAKVIAASGMLPKSFYESANGDPTAMAFVAIQLGAEVGLSPMASVQNIAIINNKPGLYGPAMLAVVEGSGLLEIFEEWFEGEGETLTAFCKVKRRGRPEKVGSFSWGDATVAKLVGKRGPWQEYPRRMMQARARSFVLRDTFPDVLLGLAYSVDELADIPAEPRPTEACDVTPPAPSIEAPKINMPANPKPPLEVVIGDGWDPAKFPRTGKGLKEALAFITGAVVDGKPGVVGLNNGLLDTIAENMPALAEEVAELRAAAAEAMKPADEPEPEEVPDKFVERFVNGDEPEADDFPGNIPPKPNP
jgi:hypothetical protein